jgi:hypothetical protein
MIKSQSKEDILKRVDEEIKRCSKNPEHFISRYIKVVHPIRGLVPFKLYKFQERILKEITEHRFSILKKFRQAGCTTLVGAYCLWYSLFNSHKTIVILSKGDLEASEVLDRIRVMYLELPEFLKIQKLEIGKDNAHTFGFSNKSVIKSRSAGKQSGRSISGSLLILDEAAFIDSIDTIWAASYPTISTGGSVVCLSTTNGAGNFFHKMYTQAERGDNEFHPISIKWQEHPEYKRAPGYDKLYEEMLHYPKPVDIDKWETNTRKNLSFKEWMQEYEAEFLGTGDTYIDGEILKQLKENVNNEYDIKYNNKMRVWKEPIPHHDYILAADTALGRGRDYSAFHIFDIYTGEQVAEFYSNRTHINEFADIIVKEARYYNSAFVLPERNMIGENLIYFLFEVHEYENILADENRDLGIQMSQKNRENLLANMEDAIRSIRVKINSERLVDELLTFIIDPDTNKIKADTNCHDDLIMSLAIAVFGFNELRLNPLIERNENTFNDKYLPPVSTSRYNKNNTVTLKSATGEISVEDISWLMKNN